MIYRLIDETDKGVIYRVPGLYTVYPLIARQVASWWYPRPQVKPLGSNISNSRNSVSSHFQTPRRELNIRRVVEYFWRNSRCLEMEWNTVSSAWCIFSIETKPRSKRRSKSKKYMLIKTGYLSHRHGYDFLCYNEKNYLWVWEHFWEIYGLDYSLANKVDKIICNCQYDISSILLITYQNVIKHNNIEIIMMGVR